MYNLLPKFIIAHQACEGEKRNRISKTKANASEPTSQANEGESKLLCILEEASKLKRLKPVRSNTDATINRYRKIRGQFSRQFRRIELAQRNRKIVRLYRQNYWRRRQQRRKRKERNIFLRNLPGKLLNRTKDAIYAGWNWIRGHQEITILACNLDILKAVQQPRALLSIFAFGATKPQLNTAPGFDSDSIPIAVDPCASASIFNEETFFTSMQPVKSIYLSGVGGKIPIKGCGTARFYITDDMGRKTSVRIDGAYFAPQSPLNLLCPQQWATQRNSKYGLADDARFTVMPEESKLSWSGGKQTKTIRYNSSNIPVLHTASGFSKFSAFVCGIIHSPEFVAFPREVSESS
jgi:hypothetical protein